LHLRNLIPITVISLASGFPQSTTSQFDAVSIKPDPPGASDQRAAFAGGPGSSDPGRITYSHFQLIGLVLRAYNIPSDQLAGRELLGDKKFTLNATLPRASTSAQFQEMLRNLLTERFEFRSHTEERELTSYNLVVAKNGPKLPPRLSAERGTKELGPVQHPASRDKDGCPVIPPNTHGFIGGIGPHACSTYRRFTMKEFAKTLGTIVAAEDGTLAISPARVFDKTGIEGEFDFNLHFTFTLPSISGSGLTTASDPSSSIFQAVEKELGLKLERAKSKIPVLVIDHALKTPKED
jgi:uncharacterized protein (TIGR03435 family)